MKHAGLVTFILIACIMGSVSAIPCFPGAEGFGTETPGGRGGRVIAVTNLNDSGPGSLRAACEAKGPRIVIFRVSGYIRLAKSLRITEPFITIAGQSAPGKGICLRDAVLQVETHDVVIRFIRVRVGPSLNEPIDRQNCIEVHGENAYNVVIDHCSFSWGLDENVGIVSKAHDCTFSYNIVSEALRKPFTVTKIGEDRSHSMALILGNFPDRCSIHHNLLANCNSRMPRIQGGTHDFVNNVVYDWGFMAGMFSRNPSVNLIGNYYKPGPSSKQIKPVVVQEDMGRIYVSGNFLLGQGLLEWKDMTDADPALHQAVPAFPAPSVTTTSATEAYRQVLSQAGCRLPAIDEVDKRIIRQAYLGFGGKIDRPEDVGGYPPLPIAFAPKDSDSDGMPDSWEINHRLDPLDPSDGPRDRNRDGYTNVEEYLNSLVSEWITQPAKVIPYPVPDAVIDSPYSVVANGMSIPIEKPGDQKGAYYARFQFSGRVRVSVTTRENANIQLKPERYCDNVTVTKNGISFDVVQAGPRVLVTTSNGKEQTPLLIIADDYDDSSLKIGSPGVFDVRDFGVTSKGMQTANIQKALDACAMRKGGGVVYFGPGVYRTGTIRIKDNTTVYLAPGALIVGSENPDDYPVDLNRTELGSHGRDCSFSRLIIFDHCHNSSIRGYGVIDGMGHIVRNRHGRHVQLMDVTGSKNITIENIVLRNSAEWTLHILGSDRVFVNNLKIINDWSVGNTDGIDPDGSRNVYIRRYFGFCGDDALAIKTTGNSDILQPAVNIEVRDSVVVTRKTGLKIGTETYADVYDVLFEACDIVNSSRGIGLWMRDGATISDVIYRDIIMDLKELEGEGMSGEPIRATIENRNGVGKIKGVLFDRIYASAPYRSIFAGMPQSKLQDFAFWGCVWQLTPRTIKMDKTPVLDIRNSENFSLRLCTLIRNNNQADLWKEFIQSSECNNITNEDFAEK